MNIVNQDRLVDPTFRSESQKSTPKTKPANSCITPHPKQDHNEAAKTGS